MRIYVYVSLPVGLNIYMPYPPHHALHWKQASHYCKTHTNQVDRVGQKKRKATALHFEHALRLPPPPPSAAPVALLRSLKWRSCLDLATFCCPQFLPPPFSTLPTSHCRGEAPVACVLPCTPSPFNILHSQSACCPSKLANCPGPVTTFSCPTHLSSFHFTLTAC